jgi:amidase
MDLTKLGAREAAALIVEGRLAAVDLTEACLERIEARDGEVRAWAHLDPEAALAQARACDALAPAGPLHGVVIPENSVRLGPCPPMSIAPLILAGK